MFQIYKTVYNELLQYERIINELRQENLSINAKAFKVDRRRNTYLGELKQKIQLTRAELITELRSSGKSKLADKLLAKIVKNKRVFNFKIGATRKKLLEAIFEEQLGQFLKVGDRLLRVALKLNLRKRKSKKFRKVKLSEILW